MYSKNLYLELFQKKWEDPLILVEDIANNKNHVFWGCARDFAKEILSRSPHWHWIVPNLDDYALLVENSIQLKKWIVWSKKGKGSLNKNLTSTQTLICWLLDRYVNQIKNLFNSKYKNHIKAINFIPFDEKIIQI